MDTLNLLQILKKLRILKIETFIFQNDWGISWALEHNEGLVLSGVGKSDD